MEATGIICEYNPLHLGHKKQIDTIRAMYPGDGIVCLMSGNYVQRGHPAIIDKTLRAQAAVLCGADLVLELPLTASLSSAEGFAAEGVRILGSFCRRLCFGAENADKKAILLTAKTLLSPSFSEALRQKLANGLSFPAARQSALCSLGLDGNILAQPNNILAVEYCKAILHQNLAMEPFPIFRQGSYHDTTPDPENPSATAIRAQMLSLGSWSDYIPPETRHLLDGAALHTLSSAESAILYRLRTMSDEEFETLPYGSEGLWRKLMHNARSCATLEQILTATKSKRYTRTRLDRMVLCAFLGLTEENLSVPAPYARVLAFNDTGRELLKSARDSGWFPNAGESLEHPYQQLENRAGSLYSLFACHSGEPLQLETNRRIFYHKR